MRGGEIREVKVETFDGRLENAYDVVPEKVGTTYLAMIVNTLLSSRAMTLVSLS